MAFFCRFSLILAAAGLVGAASVSAQTTKTQTVIIPLKWSASCPIAMRAQHGSGGGFEAVKGSAPRGTGQQLHLTLDNSGKSAISAIQITVNGWQAKLSTLRTLEANSANAEVSKTLKLRLKVEAGKSADTDVWVSGLTAADSIDLAGVNYADGLSWKPAATEPCRIAPDPETLISSR